MTGGNCLCFPGSGVICFEGDTISPNLCPLRLMGVKEPVRDHELPKRKPPAPDPDPVRIPYKGFEPTFVPVGSYQCVDCGITLPLYPGDNPNARYCITCALMGEPYARIVGKHTSPED